MNADKARSLATETADKLFTDGRGKRWDHLALDNEPTLGWGDGPVRDIIQAAILSACTAEAADCDARVQADRERCAEIAYRHFALQHISAMDCATQIRGEMCPGPTDALEAKLWEARLEEADRCMESVWMLFVSDEGSYTSRQVADKIAALRKVWAKLSENSPGPKGAK